MSVPNWEEYQRLSPDERRLRLIFSTASAAIRPEVLARFPFRPVRFINEDIQWAQEVLTAGYQLQYEPASLVYHSHDYTLAEIFQRNVDDGAANADILGRRFPAADIGPAVLALAQADQRYLIDALHLSGDALDAWQLEAVLRRIAVVMGQWLGSHYERLEPSLLQSFSLVEQTRRRGSPTSLPATTRPARPLPPPDLVYRATAATDPEAFDRGGREAVDDFASALAAQGVQLADCRAILDFGCGPGRILRHLIERVPAERLSGCDVDPHAVQWVRTHYPLVDTRRSATLPPLPYGAGAFDLVLGYSVFTHLNETYQDAWLEELQRVAAPGAWLLLTVHGNWHWQRTPALATAMADSYEPLTEQLRRGGFVYWRGDGWAKHFPDYYHTAWHSPEYIRQHWSRWFTVVTILEGQARPVQDLVVLRRAGGHDGIA